MLRSLFAALFLLISFSSNAVLLVVPTTSITGINWSVSGASSGGYYQPDCASISSDIDGAITGSGRFVIYGTLNCPISQVTYGFTGSGFINGSQINVKLMDRVNEWNCTLNSNLNGTCSMLLLGDRAGVPQGSANLTFQP